MLYNDIKEYQSTDVEHKTHSKEYETTLNTYKKLKNEYEYMDEIYKKEQAGILASKLQPNMPCIVCGSLDHPNPAKLANDIVPSEEQLKQKKKEAEDSEKRYNETYSKLTELNTKKKEKEENVNKKIELLHVKLNIENKYEPNLLEIIKVKGSELREEINRLQEKIDILAKKISLKEKIENDIKNMDIKVQQTENEIEKLNNSLKSESEKLASMKTIIQNAKKEIPQEIKDTNTLLSMISTKVKELEDNKLKLQNLRNINQEFIKQNEAQVAKIEASTKQIEEIKLDINKIYTSLNQSIKENNFEDIKEYTAYKDLINKIEMLEKEIDSYKSDVSLKTNKFNELKEKTKDLQLINLEEVSEKINTQVLIKNSKNEELKNLHTILATNKSIIKSVKNLNKDFNKIEEEYKVIGELAELSNGKKSPYISFERYVLGSYFDEIIISANLRLNKMTGERYSLRRKKEKSKGAGQQGLELVVYDNYTSKSRDVSSLSGGESFKASLSLALGLSDVVQSNAGGVSLETMFVDEGFGTLDPQSLDSAIDSLLELQRGGRLVGVISHVEELKSRIDAKLEISTSAKGSSAKFNLL